MFSWQSTSSFMERDCFASFFATPRNDVHAGVSAIKFIALFPAITTPPLTSLQENMHDKNYVRIKKDQACFRGNLFILLQCHAKIVE
jgi:hypothetical protein